MTNMRTLMLFFYCRIFITLSIYNTAPPHCWRILDVNEKWEMRNEEAPPKHGRSWNISSSTLDDIEEDDGDGEDRVARSPTPVSIVEWPDGRMGSKKMPKKQGEVQV